MKRALFPSLLALGTLACGGPTTNTGLGLSGPTSVVPFHGVTPVHPGIWSYLAVTSSRGDELRFVDQSNDVAVPGPGRAFAMSVPNLVRPILLASASLGDGSPDLLVAAGTGYDPSGQEDPRLGNNSLQLQLISTWTPEPAPVPSEVKDLSSVVPAGAPATILAISAVRLPATGSARVLLAISGGNLVVIDFQQTAISPGSSTRVWTGGPPTLVAGPLGFNPVAIAAEPDGPGSPGTVPSNRRFYLATPDEIPAGISAGPAALLRPDGKRFGVVEVTSADAPTGWSFAWLEAQAPTAAVAAANVAERHDVARVSNDLTKSEYFSPALRVYAVLDPAGCGVDQPISCGVVTLDPATRSIPADIGVAQAQVGPNQTGAVPVQDYRAPIPIPSDPLQIAMALPASNSNGDQTRSNVSTDLGNSPVTELKIAPGSGDLWTTAAAAVPATDGRTYVLDLARSDVANSISALTGGNRTAVTSVSPAASFGLVGGGTLFTDSTGLKQAIQVTPGYTDSDTWSITYQGELPNLRNRRAEIAQSGGQATLTLPDADITLPGLGIEVGDIAQITPDDPTCPPGDAAVTGIVSASRALTLQSANLAPVVSCGAFTGGGIPNATVNLRAGGYVLTGTATGLAGRPQRGQPFSLQWQPEGTLAAACLADPVANRASCLDLARVRRARRKFYLGDPQCPSGQPSCYPDMAPPLASGFPIIADPLTTGPALAFQLDLRPDFTPGRDEAIVFTTQSGVTAMNRQPLNGSFPTAVVSVDLSPDSPGGAGRKSAGTAFYVTYFGGILFELTPGQGAQTSIR